MTQHEHEWRKVGRPLRIKVQRGDTANAIQAWRCFAGSEPFRCPATRVERLSLAPARKARRR